MALPPLLGSIIGWLRAGYPQGVPEHDYIPLIALLSNQLNTDEVAAIADELAASGDPATSAAIRNAIKDVTKVQPTQADVARVSAHLAAGGWPLAMRDRLSTSS